MPVRRAIADHTVACIWVTLKGQPVFHALLIRCTLRKSLTRTKISSGVSHACKVTSHIFPRVAGGSNTKSGIPYRLTIVGVDLNLNLKPYRVEGRGKRGRGRGFSESITCPKHATTTTSTIAWSISTFKTEQGCRWSDGHL